MECPKCPLHPEMEVKTHGRKIAINRCPECGGIFALPDVLEQIKKEWFADWMDYGKEHKAKAFNQLTDISCPACNVKMEHISDPKQKHLQLERCPQCEGMYFDAGEMTDWKYETWDDMVKGILHKFKKK
jgi:Zn-finger nucleic acid-binding protein